MILSNVNVVVWRQVKRENSLVQVAVRVSKTRVLKVPNDWRYDTLSGSHLQSQVITILFIYLFYFISFALKK